MTAKEEKMLHLLYEDACDFDCNESAIMESARSLSSILPELADCEDVDDVSGVLGEFFAY